MDGVVMKRTDVINHLIKSIAAKKYLEIGIAGGENFRSIDCEYKVGVDPSVNTQYKMTSDEFFGQNKEQFDVVFVDGLHQRDQVYKDVMNALDVISESGIIICHDTNPQEDFNQTEEFNGSIWNGTCWKAIVDLRKNPLLDIYTIDTDYGCTVIKYTKTPQATLDVTEDEITFENFAKKRKEWVNLISVDAFSKKLGLENELRILLRSYISNPDDAENNFALALHYDNIDQTATALSYYLRTAERTDDDLLKYECLLKGAMCFERQGTRKFTVKGMLQHAVSIQPRRPEGYYLLSKHYETQENNDGKWFDCYTTSSIGLDVCDFDNIEPLRTRIGYTEKYALLFQKALSSWWCGLCDDSRDMFFDLYHNYQMEESFRESAYNNLVKMNVFKAKGLVQYDATKKDKMRFQFTGLDTIERNYSEAYQDMFILSLLNGKKYGTYLEIGAGNTFYGNNTALLEKDFQWRGLSLDIDQQFIDAYEKERANPCILEDATKADFKDILHHYNFHDVTDYLQIDCDPPHVSFEALLNIPFERYKFKIITFEHDYYCDESKTIRDKSRRYLRSLGYVLVAGNVSPDDHRPYEDWWVNPEFIDAKILEKMLQKNDNTKKAERYMFGEF
jgi:hypothetical protein